VLTILYIFVQNTKANKKDLEMVPLHFQALECKGLALRNLRQFWSTATGLYYLDAKDNKITLKQKPHMDKGNSQSIEVYIQPPEDGWESQEVYYVNFDVGTVYHLRTKTDRFRV
jgi:hypothetical protein